MQTLFNSSAPPPPPPLAAYGGEDGGDLSPSLLIIAALLLFVAVASASLHLLLRCLDRLCHGDDDHGTRDVPHHSDHGGPKHLRGAAAAASLIESLPVISLSAAAAAASASFDCAVCLSTFEADDRLRLLPSCGHAFHSQCIDAWLRSASTCPLCRSQIESPLPLPTPPPPQEEETEISPSAATISRGGSFRIEIGSVSQQRPPGSTSGSERLIGRVYSLGSFEYVVDDAGVVVVAEEPPYKVGDPPPPPTAEAAEEVAEAVGEGERGWLREYLDRMASSASSSMRFSRRWSFRSGGGDGGGVSWDLDLEGSGGGDESGRFYYDSFYRWLTTGA
ncbi:E3 ubiquitin-protein ligase ATL4 [Acorus gramineus]|uniref:RING-type E3 ubiquitin transferase n=1 Tax=Acorus gramineus TaxID=55184 RepID=A0AAV9BDW9_ACOGR|nr:E3 ubiquitin-protein ligase ATL4 [Acorus gramineus]